jgi:rubrerythrin
MTLQGLNDAKHWRDRAAEMRVLLDEIKDPQAQRIMLKLANDYDKLADRAEGRATEPGTYEQNAAECRQKAAQMENPQLKKKLEDMADVWDRLASERRQGILEDISDQT